MKTLFRNIVLIAGIGLMPAKPTLAGDEWNRIVEFFKNEIVLFQETYLQQRRKKGTAGQIQAIKNFLAKLGSFIATDAKLYKFMTQKNLSEEGNTQAFLERFANEMEEILGSPIFDYTLLKKHVLQKVSGMNDLETGNFIDRLIYDLKKMVSNENYDDYVSRIEGKLTVVELLFNRLSSEFADLNNSYNSLRIEKNKLTTNKKLLLVVVGVFATAYLLARYQDKVTKPALDWVRERTIDQLPQEYQDVFWTIIDSIVIIPAETVSGYYTSRAFRRAPVRSLLSLVVILGPVIGYLGNLGIVSFINCCNNAVIPTEGMGFHGHIW